MIVFDDADMEPMLPVLEKALTVFAGQFCMTGSRLLVQEAVYDTVRDRLAERLRNVRVGPASDPKSDMGPLIDKPNVERVDKIVQDAVNAGAKAIVRGGPITDGPLANGAFFRPALLEVSDNSLPIVQQETFGPVLTIQRFCETEPSRSPTTANTVCPPAFGREIWTARCGSLRRWRWAASS